MLWKKTWKWELATFLELAAFLRNQKKKKKSKYIEADQVTPDSSHKKVKNVKENQVRANK